MIPPRGHFRLPVCEELPSIVPGNVTCSNLHLTELVEEQVTSENNFNSQFCTHNMLKFIKYVFKMKIS